MEIKLTEQLLPGSLPMPEQYNSDPAAALAFVRLIAEAGEATEPEREAGVLSNAAPPQAGAADMSSGISGDVAAGNLWRAQSPPRDEDEPEEEVPAEREKVIRKRQVKKYPKQWK